MFSFNSLKLIIEKVALQNAKVLPVAGIKYFPPPKSYDDIVIPERTRLKVYDKVPMFPPNLKPPKMQKRLRYMRGPETVHNTLQLKQYGIVENKTLFLEREMVTSYEVKVYNYFRFGRCFAALGGGRMRHEHFEMARLVVARHLDQKRMFAIWRIDPPWQPVTKKGQGQRMGGGKGAIDHYCTPIKADRIILEVGGKCEYAEVHKMLRIVAERLPFKAEATSFELMQKKAENEEWKKENNKNPYNLKYIIQNNMGGCHHFLSPYEHKWYMKYM